MHFFVFILYQDLAFTPFLFKNTMNLHKYLLPSFGGGRMIVRELAQTIPKKSYYCVLINDFMNRIHLKQLMGFRTWAAHRFYTLLFMVASLFLISSCADVYTAPETSSMIRMHRSIAIIRPDIAFMNSLKMEESDRATLLKAESESVQNQMFIWLNRRIQQNGIELSVQEIHITNRLLDTFQFAHDLEELCRHLNVDAVIKSKYVLS